MPRYRIYYLKDSKVETYRLAPPREGDRLLRPPNYEDQGVIEAASPYAAWQLLQGEEAERRDLRKFGVGDILEPEGGRPILCNFWGFNQGEWRRKETEPPLKPEGKEVVEEPTAAVQA